MPSAATAFDRINPDTDWEAAVAGLCQVRADRQHNTPEEHQWFAVKRLDPAFRAARLGHTVVWDPPAALTSASRWTCVICGHAVLVREGRVYGTAIEQRCGEG